MPEEIDQLQKLIEEFTNRLIQSAPALIAALIILIIGFLVSGTISKLIQKMCAKRNIDITLSRFFSSSTRMILLLLFVMIAARKLTDISPFIALLGAGALGVSLAVQGPISNFGAGIAIIITRPFKVDDTLSVHGVTGIVTIIKLGYTQLLTEDGQEITIPNKKILGEILTNSFENLVVEGVVGIDYGADPEQAIAVVGESLSKIKGIDPEKAPQIGIEEFGDSSINIGYRYWVKTNNYYSIQYAANLEIFNALKRANIAIPFPQRDVRIVSNSSQG